MRVAIPFTVAVELAFLALFGCHRAVWRWFSVQDVPRLLAALSLAAGLSLACRVVFADVATRFYTPISVTLMNLAIALCALAGARWFRRLLSEGGRSRAVAPKAVVIVGTGPDSLSVLYALRHESPVTREAVGFIGEDASTVGSTIQGLPVLAALEVSSCPSTPDGRAVPCQRGSGAAEAPALRRVGAAPWRGASPAELIVPQSALGRGGMRLLLDLSRALAARLLVAPDYSAVLAGAAAPSPLRDVDITDLLKRGALPPETFSAHRKFLEGRCVMVTGAGGSIGSEIARQVLAAGARRLVLVERGELALFEIGRELSASPRAAAVVRHLADISDEARISRILDAERPEIVFHAAAYKHVPLMEENPVEAVRNNVFGTVALARLCAARGVGTFVLLSSDKAVEPSSVMGATKRACELALFGMNAPVARTRFTAVRFGNVLGSTGSVVPVFREQILRGGPVTVTHPDMERFFMTIPEAASLTLVAAAMAGAKPDCAFVLDMGEPVKITALAEDMIRLAGKVPGADIQIVFSGTRPGEKLRERLTSGSETLEPTSNSRISCVAIAPPPPSAVDDLLAALAVAADAGDAAAIRTQLFSFAKGGAK